MICRCGCGKEVKPGNKYILGHNAQKYPINNAKFCEQCGKEQDGGYASGRFCNSMCMALHRNKKISDFFKGKPRPRHRFEKGNDFRVKFENDFKMICEQCGNEHDGTYGAGRFCNGKCVQHYTRQFITEETKVRWKQKISQSLKGRGWRDRNGNSVGNRFKKGNTVGNRFKKGFDPERHQKSVESRLANKKNRLEFRLKHLLYEKLTRYEKIEFILRKQDNRCAICKNEFIWMNAPLQKQRHHKDGKGNNDIEENIAILCPNCHSQTENYAGKGMKIKK